MILNISKIKERKLTKLSDRGLKTCSEKSEIEKQIHIILQITSAVEVKIVFTDDKLIQSFGSPIMSEPNHHANSLSVSRLFTIQKYIKVNRKLVGWMSVFFLQQPSYLDEKCCTIAAQNLNVLADTAIKEYFYQSRENSLQAITSTLKIKDPGTYLHSEKVQVYASYLAALAGMSQDKAEDIGIAGRLHDIGKLAIPCSILKKKGTLSYEEKAEIKHHPYYGYEYLIEQHYLAEYASFVLHHHERWDGGGYPVGLKKENIPVESRILAIADAYDAMVSQRSYKPAISHERALAEIANVAGTQFDPYLADLFVNGMRRTYAGER